MQQTLKSVSKEKKSHITRYLEVSQLGMKDYLNYSLNVTFYLRRESIQHVEQAALPDPCIWNPPPNPW